ncbi:MAG TPA: hypothetical protein VK002_03895 [Rubricoccaceae bacterium]|nr:hypothetical protein [Rubricoccaceae bacterium]
MWPFIVAIIAILAWAATRIVQSGSQAGTEWVKAHGGETLEALKKQVAQLEADRKRLTQRVENLEAIVTSEAYELEREARRALPRTGQELPEGGGVPPLALEEPEADKAEDDAARAARLARRVRGG